MEPVAPFTLCLEFGTGGGHMSYLQFEISTQRILENAVSEICDIAFSVGIDGAAVLSALPESGTFLTGANVPVLSAKDRGKVSVLFYVNPTRNGIKWPFIQFHSFRHGGNTAQFNGLQWSRNNVQTLNRNTQDHLSAVPVRKAVSHIHTTDDRLRLERDNRLDFSYRHGKPLDETLSWAHTKFAGYLDNPTLARTNGRHVGGHRFLFPMETAAGTRVGYHQICTGVSDEKRHYVRQAGLMSGSFVRINARCDSALTLPPIVCEGVSTALSIALVWPGAIFAALCANNLKKVRKSIYGPVILAADNDQWKLAVGNSGIKNAREAREAGDTLLAPSFGAASHTAKPTDFNDVLMLEGYSALHQQIHSVAQATCAPIALAA